jgi:hypothetical protein
MRFPLYASRIIQKMPLQMEYSPGASEKNFDLIGGNGMIMAGQGQPA